jgi:predicted nucleic acid-binding protein
MARPKGYRRHARVREAPATRYASGKAPEALTGVLLDSDVIIEVLRGNARIGAIMEDLEQGGVPTYCTAVSWAEVYAGLRAGETPVTDEFFDARGEVVLDARAGRQAGAYLARHARSHGVGIADALVAAAAATAGLRLWTLNRRHYPMRDVRFFEP